MIIQAKDDELIVIRQTDHAGLSGFFAREWGNEYFTRPEPFESFLLATVEHDNGWTEWEMQPEIDPVTFLPYSYMSIPTEEHIALYRRGIERVVKVDRYAGLLVSMHASGLYDRTRATLPGFSAKYIKSNETALVEDSVQRLRLQQLRLKVDLRGDPAMKEFTEEKLLQANLKRLEALDCLSLFFCQASLGDSTIEGVPMDNGGNEADWELRAEENNTVTLRPYPFRRDSLEISILARRIPKRPYTDNFDFRKALATAPYFATKFTLLDGAATRTRSAVA